MPDVHDEPDTLAPSSMTQDGGARTDEAPFGRAAETWDRLAPVYDWIQAPSEFPGGWKRRARTIRGAVGDVLEIGIGTGRNLGLYPPGARLTAIDISERMIERTRARAARLNRSVDVRLACVEDLPFEDESFDTVTGTCVLSALEDPVRALREIHRVLKPGGQLRLLEHVRPRRPWLGALTDALTPIARRLIGTELNRDVDAVLATGNFEIVRMRAEGIWREIVARPG